MIRLNQTNKSRHLTKWATKILLCIEVASFTLLIIIGASNYNVSDVGLMYMLKHLFLIVLLTIISIIGLYIIKVYGSTEVIQTIYDITSEEKLK